MPVNKQTRRILPNIRSGLRQMSSNFGDIEVQIHFYRGICTPIKEVLREIYFT
jgi:hypothetical protein